MVSVPDPKHDYPEEIKGGEEMRELKLKLPVDAIYKSGAIQASNLDKDFYIKDVVMRIGIPSPVQQFIKSNELKIDDMLEITIRKV